MMDRFDHFAAAAAVVTTTAAAAAHHNVVANGLVTRTESYSFLVVGNGAKGMNTRAPAPGWGRKQRGKRRKNGKLKN